MRSTRDRITGIKSILSLNGEHILSKLYIVNLREDLKIYYSCFSFLWKYGLTSSFWSSNSIYIPKALKWSKDPGTLMNSKRPTIFPKISQKKKKNGNSFCFLLFVLGVGLLASSLPHTGFPGKLQHWKTSASRWVPWCLLSTGSWSLLDPHLFPSFSPLVSDPLQCGAPHSDLRSLRLAHTR